VVYDEKRLFCVTSRRFSCGDRSFALIIHLHRHQSSRNLHLQYLAKSQFTSRCQSLITLGSDHPPVLESHRLSQWRIRWLHHPPRLWYFLNSLLFMFSCYLTMNMFVFNSCLNMNTRTCYVLLTTILLLKYLFNYEINICWIITYYLTVLGHNLTSFTFLPSPWLLCFLIMRHSRNGASGPTCRRHAKTMVVQWRYRCRHRHPHPLLPSLFPLLQLREVPERLMNRDANVPCTCVVTLASSECLLLLVTCAFLFFPL
jgi:hypothetical protein